MRLIFGSRFNFFDIGLFAGVSALMTNNHPWYAAGALTLGLMISIFVENHL